MTNYCKKERTKVYNLYLEHFYHPSQDSYRNYARVEQDFKDRFHWRFDPLNLEDEYDIFGYTLFRKEGKPFVPMSGTLIENNIKQYVLEK